MARPEHVALVQQGRLRLRPGVRRIQANACTWPKPTWPGSTCVAPICTEPGSLSHIRGGRSCWGRPATCGSARCLAGAGRPDWRTSAIRVPGAGPSRQSPLAMGTFATRAHLHGAYLHGAHLQEANLQRAYPGYGSERRGSAWSLSRPGGPAMGQSARDHPERGASAGGEPARECRGVDHLWPHAFARRAGACHLPTPGPQYPRCGDVHLFREPLGGFPCAAAAGQMRRSPSLVGRLQEPPGPAVLSAHSPSRSPISRRGCLC